MWRQQGSGFMHVVTQAAISSEFAAIKKELESLRAEVMRRRAQVDLRESFRQKQDLGAPVTREEVAAWHDVTTKQVTRWCNAGRLQKLSGYERRAMFDPRVASRLRSRRKGD